MSSTAGAFIPTAAGALFSAAGAFTALGAGKRTVFSGARGLMKGSVFQPAKA